MNADRTTSDPLNVTAPQVDRPFLRHISRLLDTLPDILYVLDTKGRLADWNQQLELVSGYTADELRGKSALELFPPSERSRIQAAVEQKLEGERVMVEGNLLSRKGGAALYQWYGVPIFGASGEVMGTIGIGRDVTALRQAESHLKELTRQLSEAQAIAHLGSWEWDLTTNQLDWSDELYRIFGLAPRSLRPSMQRFLEFIHPDDRARIAKAAEEDFQAPLKGLRQLDYRIIRMDGTIRYLQTQGEAIADASGAFRRIIGVAQDVTDRKLAEQAIQDRETKLRAIVDHTADAIFIKDLTGRYVMMNPAGAALRGGPVESVLGRRDTETFTDESAREIMAHDQLVMTSGEGITVEECLDFLDGRHRIFSSTKFPYRGPDGSIVGVIGISRDITRQKELETAFKEQYDQLKQLDRLKGDFVNAVSHELRTPLTSIIGYAEFLEEGIGGALSSQQNAFVSEIRASAERLDHLVNDLLDYARIEAGTFRLRLAPGDLRAAVEAVLSSLEPQAKRAKLFVAADLPADPVVVPMDTQRIEQVLTNLVGNALKFTERGGITVKVERREAQVYCAVSDTGEGIAASDLPRLFNRFSQLEAGTRKGGTGLGLSIAKSIVEAHGGQIGVQSEKGVGTTFWFTIPQREASDDA
jgi:PAS domain S-box-containing protein